MSTKSDVNVAPSDTDILIHHPLHSKSPIMDHKATYPPYPGILNPLSASEEAELNTPVFAKYGEAAIAGFQVVPDLLLRNQARLKISTTDMVVLLNVLMHWWYPDDKPFPRSNAISKRMGVTPRTVQRSIQNLEAANLLVREEAADGRTYLDPKPLVDRLCELAPSDKDYLYRKGRMKAA